MTKIKGVVFDLDGTLIHTIEDIGDAANELYRRHGLPTYTTKEFISWIGNGAARFIREGIGQDLSQEDLMHYVTEFKEIYAENLHNKSYVYDGIKELLDALTAAGVKLSILSNKPHLLTQKVASYYLSEWTIAPVFGQREEVPRKPDPAAAIEIADKLKIRPEEFLFVGDSKGDLQTALAAMMKPVGVTWGYGNLGEPLTNGEVIYISHPLELLESL